MTELDKLLNELRSVKSNKSKIQNSKDVWSKIRNGNWAEAGFESQSEADKFLMDNEYSNLS